VLFPQPGYTKLDLARYYLTVAAGALRGHWPGKASVPDAVTSER
jgi:DNA primase